MLFIMVLAASSLLVVDTRATIQNDSKQRVVNYNLDTSNLPNSYRFHYDASDGSSRTEQGAYSSTGNEDPSLKVRGAVRWYNEKGHLYEMTYKAGKRGFRTIIKKIS